MTIRLYSNLMRAGENHAGLILAVQQRYSVGEQMRRLLRLIDTLKAEEMRDRIEFLSAWT
jgi:Tfp pilus assembly protein PilZ